MKIIRSIIILSLLAVILWIVNVDETSINFKFFENQKTYYSIQYKGRLDDINKIFTEWKSFSEKNNVNIGITSYSNINQITVYQTKFDPKIKKILANGRIPVTSKEYIANYNNDNENIKVGNIGIPDSHMKYAMYFIDLAVNEGSFNRLFVQASGETLKKTETFLSKYGHLKEENDYTIGLKNSAEMINVYIAAFALTLLFFFFSFLDIGNQRKKIVLLLVQGIENVSIYYHVLKKSIIIDLVIFVGSILFLKGAIYVLGYHLYSISFIKLIVIVIFLMGLYILLCLQLIKKQLKKQNYVEGLNGRNSERQLNIFNVIISVLLTATLLIVLNISVQNFMELKKNEKATESWKKAQNIYRLAIDDNVQEGGAMRLSASKKLTKLYKRLSQQSNAFLIDARNFYVLQANPYRFAFEDNINEEKDLYGFYGMSILVSENYLRYNPIKSRTNIRDQIKQDQNTLNILLPEKLKPKSKIIKEKMLDEFFEHKIGMKNETRESLGKPLLATQKKELHINLIYVRNHQDYFTYNIQSGISEKGHSVTDPIVIILNPTLDEEYIGAEMTTSMYIFDSSNAAALKNLAPILKKTNTHGVVSYVESVFDELGYEISRIMVNIEIYTLILCILFIAIFATLFNQIYWYFRLDYQRINVWIFDGKTAMGISKTIVIRNGLINVSGIIILSLAFQSKVILITGIILTCGKGLVTLLYTKMLLLRNLSQLKRRR